LALKPSIDWHTYWGWHGLKDKNMADENETQDQSRAKISALELEHRDLDDVIFKLETQGDFDQLRLSRLKKRKLSLKDQIAALRDKLLPDIIA